jgi:hypothetical protein
MPIRNPSLCENKDYFEHKMYQQRFTSHVLGAHYRKTILPRDWDLNTRFSMVYRNSIRNFTQTHNTATVIENIIGAAQDHERPISFSQHLCCDQ